jgi:3-methyl-2-oxobutanoate hydroxymethyltransferase
MRKAHHFFPGVGVIAAQANSQELLSRALLTFRSPRIAAVKSWSLFRRDQARRQVSRLIMNGSPMTTHPALLRFRNARRPIVALTAYSYPFARLLDGCDLDMILVGDSLGMVEHGRPDTTTVTLEEMILHTRSVRGGVRRALLVADLPLGTYSTPGSALAAARALRQAGADAVKLEGGREIGDSIRALQAEGIPLVGHLGMLPQRIREEGAYRIKGRTEEQREQLLADAKFLDEAGVEAIVLELVTPPVAAEITALVRAPTIGIGSGTGCQGQILVTYDLVGLTPWFRPKFVEPLASIGGTIEQAVGEHILRVREQHKTGQ